MSDTTNCNLNTNIIGYYYIVHFKHIILYESVVPSAKCYIIIKYNIINVIVDQL